jgi:hypothetical protein
MGWAFPSPHIVCFLPFFSPGASKESARMEGVAEGSQASSGVQRSLGLDTGLALDRPVCFKARRDNNCVFLNALNCSPRGRQCRDLRT